ncbi:MAG: hypothetical protein MJ113_01030 [Lachnospiraceae bacterium]|nr:hypothetical protein [Lachnospiraceae bacterium]
MEKKTFIEPEVTKVEFEFSEVIAASGGCTQNQGFMASGDPISVCNV